MAQEAHKEPTMEEILASIRKIISEDDAPAPAAQEDQPVKLSAQDIAVTDDAFDADTETLEVEPAEPPARDGGLSFEDLVADVTEKAAAPTVEDAVEEAFAPAVDAAPESVFETEPFETEDFDDEPFEEVTFDAEPEPEPVRAAEREETFVADITPPEDDELPPPPLVETLPPVEAVTAVDVPDYPAPQTQTPEVQDMTQTAIDTSASARDVSLTEDTTATAAAGALARLVSKMDMGSENTLEGIVRELVKPMLKAWLDENLPQIVEEKVEAEVQRIARLAR